MPMQLMIAALCPSKGTSTVFSLLVGVQKAGATLSGVLSSILTHALGLQLDDFTNLPLLTILCSAARLAILLCVGLVPARTPADLANRRTVNRPATATATTWSLDGGTRPDRGDAVAGGCKGDVADGPALHSARSATRFFELDEEGEERRGSIPAPSRGVDRRISVHGRPSPHGAIVLGGLIATSALWSLTSMLSNL